MKKLILILTALIALAASTFAQAAQKPLVVYYSWSGNSRVIATEIQKKTGADIFELVPEKAYSRDYNEIGAEVRREKNAKTLPALRSLPDLAPYGTVILVYPMWQGDIALPAQTFLRDAAADLAGKTLAPVCSNGGSGLARTVQSIKKAAPKATVTDGLSVRESGGANLSKDLDAWLKKTGVL